MLSERLHGNLPSTLEVNPRREGKEQCQAITLRNGKTMKEPIVEKSESKDGQNKELVAEADKTENLMKKPNPPSKEPIPAILYPQRLRKSKLEHQYAKFMEVFKKLHINISFEEALQ